MQTDPTKRLLSCSRDRRSREIPCQPFDGDHFIYLRVVQDHYYEYFPSPGGSLAGGAVQVAQSRWQSRRRVPCTSQLKSPPRPAVATLRSLYYHLVAPLQPRRISCGSLSTRWQARTWTSWPSLAHHGRVRHSASIVCGQQPPRILLPGQQQPPRVKQTSGGGFAAPAPPADRRSQQRERPAGPCPATCG